MSKNEFRELLYDMVETFGTRASDDEEDDDLWFECSECGEPILFEEWEDYMRWVYGGAPLTDNINE